MLAKIMTKVLTNLKHLPTTLAGIGVFLSALPQDPTIMHLIGISPKAATWITAVGAIGSALVLTFGTGAK